MEVAFWDSSALVPLFIKQHSSATSIQLVQQYKVVVWWSTPVEVKSAFARLLRMGHATSAEFAAAQEDLHQLRQSWQEVLPSKRLRDEAESFVDRFTLKAADAQQLAAAYTWSHGQPR